MARYMTLPKQWQMRLGRMEAIPATAIATAWPNMMLKRALAMTRANQHSSSSSQSSSPSSSSSAPSS
eukprot:11982350-Alexandrium_andersonii.AAC.1